MSVKMTYLQVRKAFMALNTLVTGNVRSDSATGAYVPELPFKVVLKVKRMIGVLSPLIEDLSDEERKIAAQFPDWNGQFVSIPPDAAVLLNDLHSVECRVGADQLTASDFSHLKDVPVTFAGVLADLGSLFVDDSNAPIAAPESDKTAAEESAESA